MASLEEPNKPRPSAAEREKNKTDLERKRDIAYTINHALACGSTDIFFGPWAAAWAENTEFGNKVMSSGVATKIFNWMFGHAHHHADEHHKQPNHSKKPHLHVHNKNDPWYIRGGKWFLSEGIGDLGAVPITVAIQRNFPGFMSVISRGMEFLMGPFFRIGAHFASQRWAKKHGIDPQSPERKAKAQQFYQHEVDHLGQAYVWTITSSLLNMVAQKSLFKGTWWGVTKGIFAATTASWFAVVGGRSLFPDAFERWDDITSKRVFIPAGKGIGKVFGVNPDVIEEVAREKAELMAAPKTPEKPEISDSRMDVAWSNKLNTQRETPPVPGTIRAA